MESLNILVMGEHKCSLCRLNKLINNTYNFIYLYKVISKLNYVSVENIIAI
jgi:hypothetical protein